MDLQEAKAAYDYELRHGNPGSVGRARRFLREAQAEAATGCTGSHKTEPCEAHGVAICVTCGCPITKGEDGRWANNVGVECRGNFNYSHLPLGAR
jgi:hypothetical protein